MNKNKIFSTKNITLLAMLTAISYVLYMFLKFPLPFFPSFLDMQFSDLPALLGGYMLGPLGGVIIIILKCLLKMPFTSTACVGELADIIVGIAFVLPSSLIYRKFRTKKWAALSLVFGTLSATIMAVIANAFILIPAYSNFFSWDTILNMVSSLFPSVTRENFYAYYLPLSVLPFNLLRCSFCSVITFFVYKALSRAVNKLFEPKKINISAKPAAKTENSEIAEQTLSETEQTAENTQKE